MNKNVKKLTLTAIFAAIAVVGSIFVSFPLFGSKCAPIQHMVNVFCAIFVGPWYGLGCAFVASLIRNIFGIGTLLAFPGSMCGALLAGLIYKIIKKRWGAYIGEVFGTSVIGGMLSYPMAVLLMDNATATLFTYVIPFLISTAVGTIIAIVIVEVMAKMGVLGRLKNMLM
ncbi:MAG: energy coupling factor transporter S component ThiW [Lachnospiraceae bacterium]|nr:energy coupling factor transporter S component ThiW [Lachnospiraceae bacterium]